MTTRPYAEQLATGTPEDGYVIKFVGGEIIWGEESGGGGGGETLEQTLVLGNTTGANWILVENGYGINSAVDGDSVRLQAGGSTSGMMQILCGSNPAGNGGALIIESGDSTSGDTGGPINILSGVSNDVGMGGTGGQIIISAGDGDLNGGNMSISAGASASSGSGGTINIAAGGATAVGSGGNGGSLNVSAGNGDLNGGSINIAAGQGGTDGGALTIASGEGLAESGGILSISAGNGYLDGGALSISAGDSSTGNAGNTVLSAGDGYMGGGLLLLYAGNTEYNNGGMISIQSGISTYGNGGNVSFSAGSGDINGGTIYISAGNCNTGDSGNLYLSGGGSAGGPNNSGGSVYVTAGPGITGGSTTISAGLGDDGDYGDVLIRGDSINIDTTGPGTEFKFNDGYLAVLGEREIRWYGGDGHYSGLQAPATGTNNIWTLPDDDGPDGYVLTTNGAGTLYWSAGGGTQIPFNITTVDGYGTLIVPVSVTDSPVMFQEIGASLIVKFVAYSQNSGIRANEIVAINRFWFNGVWNIISDNINLTVEGGNGFNVSVEQETSHTGAYFELEFSAENFLGQGEVRLSGYIQVITADFPV